MFISPFKIFFHAQTILPFSSNAFFQSRVLLNSFRVMMFLLSAIILSITCLSVESFQFPGDAAAYGLSSYVLKLFTKHPCLLFLYYAAQCGHAISHSSLFGCATVTWTSVNCDALHYGIFSHILFRCDISSGAK